MGKETGGQAYPTIEKHNSQGVDYLEYIPGMSLRDFFAGQVVIGIYSNNELLTTICDSEDMSKISSKDIVAKIAGEQSDAMIKERNK